MDNSLFLLACIGIGALLRRFESIRNGGYLVINQIIIYVCLPAATLLYTTETNFNSQYLFPILMPWFSFVGSFLFFNRLSHFIPFDRQTIAVLTLTAGIPSVSFVGFPIFEMLYRAEGLRIGIAMSQAGSFLVCGTLGVMLASYSSEAVPNWKKMLVDVIKFPTFISFCIAITLNLLHYHHSPLFTHLLTKLSSPLSFLALLSIGMQLSLNWKEWQLNAIKWGLLYKLIICPLCIYLGYVVLGKQVGISPQLSVLGAALGPMNTIAIVAVNYRLNPPLATQMVSLGIPLSLIAVMFWYLIL
jgi:malate permease and related proteins